MIAHSAERSSDCATRSSRGDGSCCRSSCARRAGCDRRSTAARKSALVPASAERCCAAATACAARTDVWSRRGGARAGARRRRATIAELLARAAYHLGNRHVPVQVGEPAGCGSRDDHVLGEMVRGPGRHGRRVDAPFEPEARRLCGAHHSHDDASRPRRASSTSSARAGDDARDCLARCCSSRARCCRSAPSAIRRVWSRPSSTAGCATKRARGAGSATCSSLRVGRFEAPVLSAASRRLAVPSDAAVVARWNAVSRRAARRPNCAPRRVQMGYSLASCCASCGESTRQPALDALRTSRLSPPAFAFAAAAGG